MDLRDALAGHEVTGAGDRADPTLPIAVARIRAMNDELRAFVSTRLDRAQEEAARLGPAPDAAPLWGLPFSLKDTWDVAGEVTTAGSHRYRAREAVEDSPVGAAFRAAGAVLVGKTNLSDLMLVPESASYVGGVCKNPHDRSRTAGGSSGGAAAAVASGMVAFDWGTDVGGSIRLPAAYCGVFGMRLSSETWPMVGDFPKLPVSLRWMNGQGPITKTVSRMRDTLRVAAPALRTGHARPFRLRGVALHGPERRLGGEWPTFERDAEAALRVALEGATLATRHGLPSHSHGRRVAVAMWASHFEDLLESDSLTLGEGLRAALSALVFRGRRGDRRIHPHTAAVLALVVLGRVSVFRDAARARRDAQAYRDAIGEVWDRGTLIVSPTSTWPAPKHGASFRNPNVQVFTMGGNVADATALSVPFGRFRGGMPRGLSILGPPGSEDAVLELGERLARAASSRPE